MPQHARPHLHTHQRGKRHSAVAGAAYRLGIDLLDERTGALHKYSKRAGKEVVHAETIGPPGVPASMLDPGVLWNLVDKAEKQSTAQIARDFRMPIPLGLGKDDAVEMARGMARFIVARFNTPVSIGVHRDNAVDLDGNTKDESKVGFHAHLYFPTRELEKEGSGASALWFLGRKLSELSNRNTSGEFVDTLNAKWATLANRYAANAGLEAKYESKSYKRLGLDIQPKPERARRFGKDNKWYKPTGAFDVGGVTLVPGERRRRKERLHADRAIKHSPAVRLDAAAVRQRILERRATRALKGATSSVGRLKRRARAGTHGKAPLLNRVRLVGGRMLRMDSHLRLAEAMRRAGPPPRTEADQAALERAMFFADLLESLLFSVERARQAAGDFAMQKMRREMRLADAASRQSIVDGDLRRAEQNLDRWMIAHPLRAQLRRASGQHASLVEARDRAARHARQVCDAVRKHEAGVSEANRVRVLQKMDERKAHGALLDALQAYKTEFPAFAEALIPFLDDTQKMDIKALAVDLDIDGADLVSTERADAPFNRPQKPH
ncbi:MobA/MobL family protein [Luteibacter aegosomaticola]|uniref:MobA/MobL family protein n=1 Tax=Luteibacter aegosomaticola TaxID=2911538 RepID=UPI001FFB7515|nr:MobA/MobL family protein [Luteibacter aegosomaticola]UPG88329.1 MobA/MobL family protein [Luteibacter aegosomaticola]